jgi:hypothetical protein
MVMFLTGMKSAETNEDGERDRHGWKTTMADPTYVLEGVVLKEQSKMKLSCTVQGE